jgi:hypothetical protein
VVTFTDQRWKVRKGLKDGAEPILVHLPAEHGCQDEVGLVPLAFSRPSPRGLPTRRLTAILTDPHKVKSEVEPQGVTSQMTDERQVLNVPLEHNAFSPRRLVLQHPKSSYSCFCHLPSGRQHMVELFQRIDGQTMALVQEFAQQFGCSDEIALQFLLKVGRYPQEAEEDDEAYAARLERLPDPDVMTYRDTQAANDL